MVYPTRTFTLVFTDSRGKDLHDYLDNHWFLVQAFSGAGHLEIIDRSVPYVTDFHPACILYISGTCDLTNKDKLTKKFSPKFDLYMPIFGPT